MLEWLICAASVATHVVVGTPASPARDDAAEDFLEFLAEWDETDGAVFETEADPVADADQDASAGGGHRFRTSHDSEVQP